MKMKAWVLEDIGNIKYKEVLKPLLFGKDRPYGDILRDIRDLRL